MGGYTAEFTKQVTEERNANTMDLDVLDTLDLVKRVQNEDFVVAEKVREVIPQIAQAVDIAVEKVKSGGRIFYFGAGTSGRLGVLDAAECPPTFGVSSEQVQAFIAGGREAMFRAFENAEDLKDLGFKDATAANITAKDIAIGITASGRTAYVVGALEKAKELGASTVSILNNHNHKLEELSDVVIAIIVGPEAISGSTRMKAGTAQKMVLNLLSTCTMVRLGKVYENLMVDLRPTNEKLRERAVSMISLICSAPRNIAEGALVSSHDRPKTAILMAKRKLGRVQAEELLDKHNGSLRQALAADLK